MAQETANISTDATSVNCWRLRLELGYPLLSVWSSKSFDVFPRLAPTVLEMSTPAALRFTLSNIVGSTTLATYPCGSMRHTEGSLLRFCSEKKEVDRTEIQVQMYSSLEDRL